MDIETLHDQDAIGDTVEFSVTLSPEEADALAAGAFRRIAAALHVDEAQARVRAAAMMTEREMSVLTEETVKSRAADQAFDTLGTAFLLSPSLRARAPLAPDEPFTVDVSAFAVPHMELDLETPIAIRRTPENGPARDAREHAGGETPPVAEASERALEALVRDTLRARLRGIVPASLANAAAAQEHAAFQRALEEAGETYREYRIRTGRKPAQVEEELRGKAERRLHEDIALEIVFREKGLAVTPDDEAAVLHEMAPGNACALRAELDNAGKRWMLGARARRRMALRWAVENLAER